MQSLVERCCGLDVHQETVVACRLLGAPERRPRKEIRTFRTVTRELEALRDWLRAAGVTHVGMESTGVYWRPVYAVLEAAGCFTPIVGNARHIKNVPGRKTDVKDAEWIAQLVRHGLIAPSFVPPPPLRALRELLRYRRKLAEAQAAERNRLLKLLETANLKLASVMSDVFGVSGRAILRALIAGGTSAAAMAELARGTLRRKRGALVLALEGRLDERHRFLLAMQLRRLEAAEQELAALDREIDRRLDPYAVEHALLMQIPGVDRVVAAVLLAEIGPDMSVFASARHLAAWAGVCPGNHESAGKQTSGRARHGNVHLKTMLVQAAVSASHKRGSYLKDKYHRLKARRGSGAGDRAQDPDRRLPHPAAPGSLPRARRSLPRSALARPNRRQLEAPPRTPRLPRHPRRSTRGCLTPQPGRRFHGRMRRFCMWRQQLAAS